MNQACATTRMTGMRHGPGAAGYLSRRRWLHGAAALVGAGPLAACAGRDDRASSAASAARMPVGTTLTYVSSHSQQEFDLFQAQFRAFEAKYPGAKVDFANSAGNIADKLITLLAAGTPFDMFYMGQTGWPGIANKGGMLELDSRVKRDKYDLSDFYDAAVSQYLWRGKHIGMGATVGYTVIYYNPGPLQEKGIPLPSDDWGKAWTWEQFLDVMRRVTVPGTGGVPERYGVTGFSVERLQITNGVQVVDAEGTRTFYTTPEAIETFDWMFDLIHTYRVAQSPLTTKQLPAAQAFITGKSVSWLASTPDSARQLVPQKELVWDSAPTPRGPRLKSDKWTYGGGNGRYLAAPSKAPDAAWELFKFMLSPEVAHKLAAGGLPPSRISVANSPSWLRPGDPPAHKRPMIDGAKLLTPAPKLVNYRDFSAAVADEVQYLWRAERRGREVAERIGQRVAPILAEHQRLFKEGK